MDNRGGGTGAGGVCRAGHHAGDIGSQIMLGSVGAGEGVAPTELVALLALQFALYYFNT